MKIFELDYFKRKVLNNQYSFDEIKDELTLKKEYYYKVRIPKKNSTRVLHCLDTSSSLYNYQRLLKNNFFDLLPTSEYSYGYKKNVSYKDFFVPHINQSYYLRLDIKDFFGSIDVETLRKELSFYILEEITTGDGDSLIDTLIDIVTIDNVLPQGAVTSPALSNIVCRELDIRISRYCAKFNINYSRYVDDLLFSSNRAYIHKTFFLAKIKKILAEKKFKLNSSKIIKTEKEISLKGFVVGQNIRISRKKRQIISTILHCFENSKPSNKYNFLNDLKTSYGLFIDGTWVNLQNYLSGYRSFLISWLPTNTVGELSQDISTFDKKNQAIIKRIEDIILFLND